MTASVRRTPPFLLQATLLSANTRRARLSLVTVPQVNSVEYPLIRHNVMDSLAVLADIEYQQRVWVNPAGSGRYEDFDLDVHTLYDDTNVLSAPEDNLGSILLPGDELDRLRQLDEVLDRLLKELGDVPGLVYTQHPDWPEVARRAGLALAAMVRAWNFELYAE
jgi:hypothetical protein